jgi:hypothetical protein
VYFRACYLRGEQDYAGRGVRQALSRSVRCVSTAPGRALQQEREQLSGELTLTGPGTPYPTAGAVVAVGPLPNITNKLTRANLYGLYALEKNSELRFDYIYERWQTDDWSWLFANGTPFTYGTTTDGTQVVMAPRQTSNFVGVRYIYRFQ